MSGSTNYSDPCPKSESTAQIFPHNNTLLVAVVIQNESKVYHTNHKEVA